MKFVRKQKLIRKKSKAKKRAKRRALIRKLKGNQSRVSLQFSAKMSGETYWKNYVNVFNWQRSYMRYIKCCDNYPSINSLIIENRNLSLNPRTDTSFKENNHSIENSDLYEEKDADSLSDKFNDLTTHTDNELDTDSEDEYVVTEEMMKFLEISVRHRLEREKKKKELANQEKKTENSKLSQRDDIEECQTPKAKAADAIRLKEMNDLYGKSAAKIMGMETALQLTFNKNCDLRKPAYWPVLPLNMKFSD